MYSAACLFTREHQCWQMKRVVPFNYTVGMSHKRRSLMSSLCWDMLCSGECYTACTMHVPTIRQHHGNTSLLPMLHANNTLPDNTAKTALCTHHMRQCGKYTCEACTITPTVTSRDATCASHRNGTITAPLAGRVQAGVDAWARVCRGLQCCIALTTRLHVRHRCWAVSQKDPCAY